MSKKPFDIPGIERVSKKKREAEKVTWDMIYDDFDMRHPNSRKYVSYKEPADVGVARVFMCDGRVLLYYYDTHSTVPDYNYMEKIERELMEQEGLGDSE